MIQVGKIKMRSKCLKNPPNGTGRYQFQDQ
jgi:hypothetical protein